MRGPMTAKGFPVAAGAIGVCMPFEDLLVEEVFSVAQPPWPFFQVSECTKPRLPPAPGTCCALHSSALRARPGWLTVLIPQGIFLRLTCRASPQPWLGWVSLCVPLTGLAIKCLNGGSSGSDQAQVQMPPLPTVCLWAGSLTSLTLHFLAP